MVDLQKELATHQNFWGRFIKSSFWIAGVIAIVLILMWIFLV